MPERRLSVDDIPAHLGVNLDTIYKWITRKGMPTHELTKRCSHDNTDKLAVAVTGAQVVLKEVTA